jgi:hypothetical protein
VSVVVRPIREMAKRKKIPPKLKYEIRKRDGFMCVSCGRTAKDGVKLHIDHKVPIALGGTNDPDNLQTLCQECNLGKSATHPEDRSYLERDPNKRKTQKKYWRERKKRRVEEQRRQKEEEKSWQPPRNSQLSKTRPGFYSDSTSIGQQRPIDDPPQQKAQVRETRPRDYVVSLATAAKRKKEVISQKDIEQICFILYCSVVIGIICFVLGFIYAIIKSIVAAINSTITGCLSGCGCATVAVACLVYPCFYAICQIVDLLSHWENLIIFPILF